MKYKIPYNLADQNFECENCGIISNCFTFNKNCEHCEDCDECGFDECWEAHITKELQFKCNCTNANALEEIYHCSKCKSDNIEVMADDDEYEIMCMDCDHTEIITEKQMEKLLQDKYTYLDKDELKKAVDKVLVNDTFKIIAENKKVGRNDPCPCGSGKKYKNCHGN